MRRLIIHIGNHKTGSTSIQESLVLNNELLEFNGFKVCRTNYQGKTVPWAGLNGWVDCSSGNTPVLRDGLAQALSASPNKNVIISAETFSFLNKKSDLGKLHNELQTSFDKIEVVVYIRRQDRQILSHSLQASKPASNFDKYFLGFGKHPFPRSINRNLRNYLDYNKKIGLWSEVFGDKNIKVRVFDKKYLHHGDVVSDFYYSIGLDYVSFASIKNKNEAVGFEKNWVGHFVSELGLEADEARKILFVTEDSKKCLPARQDAINILEGFKSSNERLNDRFKITENKFLFDEDFSYYPETSNLYWDEQHFESFLASVFRTLIN